MARIAAQIARRARGGKAIGASVSVCCRRGTGAVTSVARSDRSVKVAFWGKQTTCSCSPEPREVESRTKLVAFSPPRLCSLSSGLFGFSSGGRTSRSRDARRFREEKKETTLTFHVTERKGW